MTKPATNKNINWTTALTVIIFVTGLAVLAAMYWNKNTVVSEIVVSGNYYTDTQEVLNIASSVIGLHPDSLNIPAFKNKLETLNYVESVTPFVEPSGRLRIEIKERQPLALLISGSERAYVDGDGVVLEIRENKYKHLPLLYGYDFNLSDTLSNSSFRTVSSFLSKAKKNAFGWATISEVVYTPDEGVVALSHENGVKLIFGHNDFETKLENWKAFYTQVVAAKGISRMNKVDLRFKNQVVTHEI